MNMQLDYTINVRGKLLSLKQPQVMGILNCTPDSFYAGSRKQTEKEIIEEANKRYNSFFERDHFIRSAEETFCLIQYRKKQEL
jgi:hypothetical protein